MKTIIYRKHLETTLGRMVMLASHEGLCAFDFVRDDRLSLLSRKLKQTYGKYEILDGDHPAFMSLQKWCGHYFNKDFVRLRSPSLHLMGSPFEKKVWARLQEIPVGTVMTYGQMAKELGCKSPRAVGRAVGRNPFSMIVPCHRVIGADQSLTGFGGGLDRKHWLLNHEGLRVTGKASTSKLERPNTCR